MKGWKSFTLLALLILMAAGSVCLVFLLRQPETTEVERVFDGTEVVFIEGSGLLSRWRILTTTKYMQSRTYEGLEELPPVRDALAALGGGNGAWIDHVNADAIMSAVGDESALGIYAANGRPSRFLFVSRVDPNFLLADRLLAFAGADAGITITEHRDTRVKEAALDRGRPILWALDGDFLILSDDPKRFYAALDRHIDGTVGPIAASREFRRIKAMGVRERLISGYVVTKRLATPGGLAGFLPDAAVLSPDPLFFSVSYAGGVIVFEAKSMGRLDIFELFPDNVRKQRREPSDGVLAVVSAGPIPPARRHAEEPAQEPSLARLLPLLFPDGFTMCMLGDERCGGPPATVAAGETRPSTKAAIDRLREMPGITILDPAEARAYLPAVEKQDGRLFLAVADRNGRTVVSDRPDLLAGIPAQTLETGGGLGYTTAHGEISFAIAPRLLYREIERCGHPIPSVTLSLGQQRRLLSALLPAQRIDGHALIERDRLTIDIAIHIEDAIP